MLSSTLKRLNERRALELEGEAEADAGFTLIELMVVLLILAILLAIAIPTFLGVTKSANDRAVQSNLNTAFTDAKASYQTYGQSYSSSAGTVTAAILQSAEPSLSFTAGTNPSTGQGLLSVYTATDGNAIVLAAYSPKDNTCWLIIDAATITADTTAPLTASGATTNAGTYYGKYTGNTSSNCTADAPGGTLSSWQTTGFPS